MDKIPNEIITRILRYLNFPDRTSMSLVCKRFHQACCFKELWSDVTYVFLDLRLPSSLPVLTSIRFYCLSVSMRELATVLSHSRSLHSLGLNTVSGLFDDVCEVRRYLGKEDQTSVGAALSRLRSLSLSGNDCYKLNDEVFPMLLYHCTGLEKLDMSSLDMEPLKYVWTWTSFLVDKEYAAKIKRAVVSMSGRLTFACVLRALLRLPLLVDVDFSRTSVGPDDLSQLLLIPGLCLHSIRLANCHYVELSTLQLLVRSTAKCLQELDLMHSGQLSLCSSCPNAKFPVLKVIRLTGSSCMLLTLYPSINIPSLTELYFELYLLDDSALDTLNGLNCLTSLSLIGCSFSKVTKSVFQPSLSLRRLDLSKSYNMAWPGLISSVFRLPRLEDLRLDWLRPDCPPVPNNDGDITSFSSSEDDITTEPHPAWIGQLHSLSLVGTKFLSGLWIRRLFAAPLHARHCQLQVLRTQGLAHIDDELLQVLTARVAPHLRELDLSGSLVTDSGLLGFLATAHQLRQLRLDDCNLLSASLAASLRQQTPFLQQLSMRNCELIPQPVGLSYHDGKFLYETSLL